ncbi:MAG: DUF6144 family protein [Oscillospiraceae bacterium]
MYDIRKIQEQVIFGVVKAASNDETAAEIVYGMDGQASSENDPAWVHSAMNRLENRFDKSQVKHIRMNCQCGYGLGDKLALLKELLETSSSMEEFADQDKARAAGLSCSDGELFLQFAFCPCPMLAEVERLESDAWCQCTTGYSKVLFEKAFDCKVDVELMKSIKMGDSICLQKITLHNYVWKQENRLHYL